MELTAQQLQTLLGALGANSEIAGAHYERIRQRLVQFFEWRGCASPEELADRSMDRVAKRLEAGREIWTEDPISYFYGVARNILREHWAEEKRDASAQRRWATSAVHSPGDDADDREGRLAVLEHCLGVLPEEDRELIVRYYTGQKQEKIRNRGSLASALEIAPAALRLRAFRVRAKLEACLDQNLELGSPRKRIRQIAIRDGRPQ